MKLQKLAMYGTLMFGLSGLGCKDNEERIVTDSSELYFAIFPMHSRSGMAIDSGDFDGDGDLDFIVGAFSSDEGKLYLYLNDGDANFTIRNPNFAAESTLNQPPYGWPDCSGNRWETDACAETRHRLGHD